MENQLKFLDNYSIFWGVQIFCIFMVILSEWHMSHITRKPVFGGFRPSKSHTHLLIETS